jgi:hypothetical protein
LLDFLYEAQKKAKKYMKERELSGWNDVVFWNDFRLSYISEAA